MKRKMMIFLLVALVAFLATKPGFAEDAFPQTPDDYPKPVAYPWVILDEFFPNVSEIWDDGSLIEPRIVGGSTYTPENKYPWIVSLQYNSLHYCGGSLIDEEWVLTTAHCWTDPNGETYVPHPDLDRVVLGEYKFSVISSHEQEIGVEDVFIHPYYNYLTFQYDLALLKLSEPAVINDYVQTIGIATERPADYAAGTIVGWGATYYDGSPVDTVLEASIQFLPDSWCSGYGVAFDSSNMLCGGMPDYSRDTCQGDSGGSFFYDDGGNYLVAGVTSWGYQCASDGFPGVYSDAVKGSGWIYSTMNSALPDPTPVAPLTGESAESAPVFEWIENTYSINYILRAERTSDSALVLWRNLPSNQVCNGSGCTYTSSKLFDDGEYRWTLRGINDFGDSPTTSAEVFTIGATTPLPGLPTLLSPVGGETASSRPTFEWTAASYATSYILRAERTSDGALALWKNLSASSICSGGTCSYTSPLTFVDGGYSWTVRGVNSSGGGPTTATETFNVGTSPLPGLPTLLFPIGGETASSRPTFEWTAASNATSYILRAERTSDGALALWKNLSASSICSGGTCSYTSPLTFVDGGYSWTVRGVNSSGSGPTTAAETFNVGTSPLPGLPTLLSPIGGTTVGSLPTFEWAAATNATSYILRAERTADGALALWKNLSASSICSGGTCSYTSPLTFVDGEHSWTVRGVNSSGSGPTTAAEIFIVGELTLPGLPALLSPIGGATVGSQPTFEWVAATNATSYILRAERTADGALALWKNLSASSICSGGTCSYASPIVFTSGGHTWFVRGVNSLGNGPISSIESFNVSE